MWMPRDRAADPRGGPCRVGCGSSEDQVDVPALLAEITGRLEARPKRDAASLRGLRREVSPAIAAAGPRTVIDLAIELFRSGVPGSHVIAYELVVYHGSALSAIRAEDLRRFGAHMASWGEVDAFAGIAGPAWRSRQISDETVASWARSSNRWWRRAALVSTVPLNVKSQGGHGDPERTLAVCDTLVDDRDPMVVKALSWALRALAARDSDAVHAFLKRNEGRLAPVVVREVRNKLETGRKGGRPRASPRRR